MLHLCTISSTISFILLLLMTTTMGEGSGRLFTVTQLQELELQSLILISPLASGEASSCRLILPHASSVDAEPGRCRRTHGKKWRCSKEVHPNSRYCDRHMHRGKNRLRKPLELLSSSTMLHTHSFLLPCSSSPLHKCSDFNGGGQVETLEVSSAEEARQRYGHRQIVHAHSGICLPEEGKEKERFEFGADFEIANLEEEKTTNGRQFHWFLDEKPLKVEGSWMRVGLRSVGANLELVFTMLIRSDPILDQSHCFMFSVLCSPSSSSIKYS